MAIRRPPTTFSDTISTADIADDAITTAKVADDQITLAKMAVGTDGQIITYDASGNPTAIGPGTSGQVITSAGAGASSVVSAESNSVSLSAICWFVICVPPSTIVFEIGANPFPLTLFSLCSKRVREKDVRQLLPNLPAPLVQGSPPQE